MNVSVLEDTSSFRMLGLSFSSKLDWSSEIIFIVKTVSKDIGAFIRFMKLVSLDVALYLYKCTAQAYMEYCCHVWDGVPNCHLELLDKLWKPIYQTVISSLTVSLVSLCHQRNVANLSLFRCSCKLTQLVSTCHFDGLHDVSVTIPRCYQEFHVSSFFPYLAKVWNSLPIEWYHVNYDANDVKSRMKRHLFKFLLNRFPVYFNIIALSFLVTPWLVVAV